MRFEGGRIWPVLLKSFSIWWTSSRVGARIRARGNPFFGVNRLAKNFFMRVIRKVALLPVPVWAFAVAIDTFKGMGQKLGLYVRAVLKFEFCNGMHQAKGQVQVMEPCFSLLWFNLKFVQGPRALFLAWAVSFL